MPRPSLDEEADGIDRAIFMFSMKRPVFDGGPDEPRVAQRASASVKAGA